MAWIEPLTLSGRVVRLEPLRLEHESALIEAAQDGELWKIPLTWVPEPPDMRAFIERTLREQEQELRVPFVVVHLETETIVGSTQFWNLAPQHRHLEIGSTWLRQSFQRTSVNTEAKFLLLRYAFETLSCIAIELRTHERNEKSRRAIERLGARFDGLLRHHMIMRDGSFRNTAVYSITNEEWPRVKANLTAKMAD